MGYYFMVLIFLTHWNLVFVLLNFSNFLPISWAIWFCNVWQFTCTEKSIMQYHLVNTRWGQTLQQTPKVPGSVKIMRYQVTEPLYLFLPINLKGSLSRFWYFLTTYLWHYWGSYFNIIRENLHIYSTYPASQRNCP